MVRTESLAKKYDNWTARINQLGVYAERVSGHLLTNPKDHSARRKKDRAVKEIGMALDKRANVFFRLQEEFKKQDRIKKRYGGLVSWLEKKDMASVVELDTLR